MAFKYLKNNTSIPSWICIIRYLVRFFFKLSVVKIYVAAASGSKSAFPIRIRVLIQNTGTLFILCPFAVYYLRYAVRSFFIISRISAKERDKKKIMSRSFLNSGTLIVKYYSVIFLPLGFSHLHRTVQSFR